MKIRCVESPADSMTVTELRGRNVIPGMDGLLKIYFANDEDDYCVIVGPSEENALYELLKERTEKRMPGGFL